MAGTIAPDNHLSVVIPVYRGERSLPILIEELIQFSQPWQTAAGNGAVIDEIILVHDCGPDHSDAVIQELSAAHLQIRPIWLSRNFGQHPATLAGMAGALGDWVITMDEDGQHDPRDIGTLLDQAIRDDLQLVYARPLNPPHHGPLRNFFSRMAKRLSRAIHKDVNAGIFQSFRLIDGEIARNLAAYCGRGVFLDVALRWIVDRTGTAPVTLRREWGRPSGYSYRKLVSHFWTMILSSGAKPLRWISGLGCFAILFGVLLSVFVIAARLTNQIQVPGWSTLIMTISFFSGCILTALGVVAEYMALITGIALGQPLYLTLSRPRSRQLRSPEGGG
ncbi:MAG: glycosyltransferase family 2 protein [Cyanobacteriota bacterium]|nr:glycosyltransferase family 2 protein [Cyanobacteriota bacterium]